jgi:hypothetical protein
MGIIKIPKHGIKCKHASCDNYKMCKNGYCNAHSYQFNRYNTTWDVLTKGENFYTFLPDGFIKITISNNKYTLIDVEDYSIVSIHRWYYVKIGETEYAHTSINGKTIRLHRFLYDCADNEIIDHINRNGLDNRKSNLRICPTFSHNNVNSNMANIKSKSGYKGVRQYTLKNGIHRYYTEIKYQNITYRFGPYNSPLEAHKTYSQKGKELYGEFFINSYD